MSAAKLKGEDFTITFADGSSLVVDQHEWEQTWDDVREGRPNKVYERMKYERDRGNTDNRGMVHLLEVFDPEVLREVWKTTSP